MDNTQTINIVVENNLAEALEEIKFLKQKIEEIQTDIVGLGEPMMPIAPINIEPPHIESYDYNSEEKTLYLEIRNINIENRFNGYHIFSLQGKFLGSFPDESTNLTLRNFDAETEKGIIVYGISENGLLTNFAKLENL